MDLHSNVSLAMNVSAEVHFTEIDGSYMRFLFAQLKEREYIVINFNSPRRGEPRNNLLFLNLIELTQKGEFEMSVWSMNLAVSID